MAGNLEIAIRWASWWLWPVLMAFNLKPTYVWVSIQIIFIPANSLCHCSVKNILTILLLLLIYLPNRLHYSAIAYKISYCGDLLLLFKRTHEPATDLSVILNECLSLSSQLFFFNVSITYFILTLEGHRCCFINISDLWKPHTISQSSQNTFIWEKNTWKKKK